MKRTIASLLAAAAVCVSATSLAQLRDESPKNSANQQSRVATDAKASRGDAKTSPHAKPPDLDVLSKNEWQRIDLAVERALKFMASRQGPNGAFHTIESGQPAVTSLCIMAFLSAGHKPSEGPYGDQLDRAIDYALDCQRTGGLFSAAPPIQSVTDWYEPTHTANYNHAITGLMLGEVYGSGGSKRAQQIAEAIEKALALTRQLQIQSRRYPLDAGGWRYLKPVPFGGAEQSDLSMTGWQIMFLRSAMNAGFDVPEEFIEEATDYVKRCFNREKMEFFYGVNGHHRVATRAVTGSGLLCLYLSGKSDPEMERAAGRWMVSHSFRPYNEPLDVSIDRYHYGAYYCSMAAFQLGGEYWAKLYRHLAEVLLENQNADGSWAPESRDPMFGNVYTTALVVLTLSPPYQLLPIYQR